VGGSRGGTVGDGEKINVTVNLHRDPQNRTSKKKKHLKKVLCLRWLLQKIDKKKKKQKENKTNTSFNNPK